MSTFKNIFSKILFCLLLLISILLISKLVAKKVFNNYFFLGYDISYIASGSMEPTLNINDYVFCIKTKKIKKGDIIVYRSKNNARVIHRVIDINDDEIITQGDNNDTPDEAINLSKVEGKYVKTLMHSSKLTSILSNQFFRYALILILGILLIVTLVK